MHTFLMHPIENNPICLDCAGNAHPRDIPRSQLSGPQWCSRCGDLIETDLSRAEVVVALDQLERRVELAEATEDYNSTDLEAFRAAFRYLEPMIGDRDENLVTAQHIDHILSQLENPQPLTIETVSIGFMHHGKSLIVTFDVEQCGRSFLSSRATIIRASDAPPF